MKPNSNGITRRRIVAGAAAATAAMGVGTVLAQSRYPNRPIRVLVGFPAGGIADILMRTAVIEAEKKIGQPFVIENKPGAAGLLAYQALKIAPPDGYVIGNVNTATWRLPIMQDVSYDPLKDFSYILNMVENIFAVTVNADSPFKTWADLLAFGKANPSKMTYGAPPGLGQSAHMFMEEVGAREKVKWEPIGYKGSSESITALLGGHITFAVDTVIATSTFVRSGKARYLAVASNRGLKSWPDVPTMAKLGYNITIDSPIGLAAPAGTPPDIVKALHDAFHFALEQPSMRELLDRSDQGAFYMNSADFTRYVAKSMAEQRELLTRYGFAKKT